MISWAELHAFKEAVVTATANGVGALVGFILPAPLAAQVLEYIRVRDLINGGIYATLFVIGMFVLVYTLESLTAARRTRYVSRVFRHDVLYTLLYKGGMFEILVWTAVATALAPRLGFLRLGFTRGLPAPVSYALTWVIGDFLYYWWHRSLHKWNVLWAFHSVHHTQEEMNFATAQRLHPVEMLGQYLVMYIPLLLMGIPTYNWVPVAVVMNVFLALQHSSLGWGYGWAYYLVVSPRFHELHHSTDRREYLGNYATILSLWDFLFGTGIRTEQPPAKLGVEGLPVSRTLAAQFMAPFRILWPSRRAEAAVPAVQEPSINAEQRA